IRHPARLARVPTHERQGPARAADRHVRAARQVRRRPARFGPARARRRGRPRLVRAAGTHRRHRTLRPRARHQVRDVRDRSDQGRDHRRAARARLGASFGALEAKLGRAPTDDEIAAKIGISTDELEESLTDISRSSIAALDELWSVSGEGDQISLLDTIEDTSGARPADALDETELKELVADAISRLPEREKLVITLYYYEELTLREIGEVLGVTESRVSQLHTKAILRLKSRLSGVAART